MADKEIKLEPKMEKTLLYLGFEEKNLNIKGVSNSNMEKRYFVHPFGVQIRVNKTSKTLSIINNKGYLLVTKPTFLSSYVKNLILEEGKGNN